MAIYYVSPYGSDSSNGLGPDPTNPTNKPFLTPSKALGSALVINPGDTVYIAPGVYRAGFGMGNSGSPGNPIVIAGDPGNAQGFKDGSGNIVPAGEVRITDYPSEITAPAAGSISGYIGGSYLSISSLWFIGSDFGYQNGSVWINGGHDISFTACMFSHGLAVQTNHPVISASNTTAQLAMNLTFDRCIFAALGATNLMLVLTRTSSGSADYNANVLIQNSLFLMGGFQVWVLSGGSGTYMGGGVTVRNCTGIGAVNAAVATGDSGLSTTVPAVTVQNNIFLQPGQACLSANNAGQIVEDYNYFSNANSPNVAPGAHSTSDGSRCMMLDFGQWALWGQSPKAFATPTAGSPLLGFGNAAGAPNYDFLGRPRPEGGGSLLQGIGYSERHDTAVQENTITDSGGVGIRIDGPGSHEFQIPVDAIASTISVKCYFDANHGTATPPQAVLVACPEIGVAGQTVVAPANVGQWQTLTFATITPTARGVIRVQLAARPAAAIGKAYFDTFAVS